MVRLPFVTAAGTLDRHRRWPAFLTALALVAISWTGTTAHAQDGDGVYGRLDGDLALSAGLGGGVVHGDRQHVAEWSGTATLELRARVLDMAGVLLAGEWRPEGDERLIVAADLRPLFFARWLLNASSRRAWADLLVDSIGLDLGVAIGPFEKSPRTSSRPAWPSEATNT